MVSYLWQNACDNANDTCHCLFYKDGTPPKSEFEREQPEPAIILFRLHLWVQLTFLQL
jgi:hypothetical protein